MSRPIECPDCGAAVDPGKHYDDRTCPPCAESATRELVAAFCVEIDAWAKGPDGEFAVTPEGVAEMMALLEASQRREAEQEEWAEYRGDGR